MSLTFQLARGVLALTLFAVLSLTAWLAPAATPSMRVIFLSESAPVTPACPVAPPAMRLALSPADLPVVNRAPGSCRA